MIRSEIPEIRCLLANRGKVSFNGPEEPLGRTGSRPLPEACNPLGAAELERYGPEMVDRGIPDPDVQKAQWALIPAGSNRARRAGLPWPIPTAHPAAAPMQAPATASEKWCFFSPTRPTGTSTAKP